MVNYYKSDLSKIIRYDLFNYSVLHKSICFLFFYTWVFPLLLLVVQKENNIIYEWPRPPVPLK